MASDNVDEQTLHLTVRLRAEEEKTEEEEEEEIGGLINSDGEAEEWSGGDRLTGPSDAADQPQNIQTKESPTLATKDDETSEKKTSRGQRARDSKPPVDEKKHVGETIKRETRARKPVNYHEQTEEFEPQTARQLRRRTTSLKKEDNNNATRVCKAAGKKHPGRKMLSVPLVIPPELLKVPKEKMKYQCSVCGKEFPHAYKLERHELIHTGEKPYCCSICGRGFNQKGNLKTHYKVHLGHNSAVDIELEVNPVASQLTEYLKTLPGESRLKTLSDCLECERDLEYQSDLRAHHLTGHSVTAADSSKHNSALFFFCRRCGIKFSEREKLAEHMKTHVKEKPYSCPDCGKRFINESYVHVHQRIHTGEKPFLCSQCGRGFHTATSLKMHEMQHTGEKPFVCSMCGKRFRMNSYLTAHYQTHMNDRPFICGVCGKGYSRAEELKVHNRLHTGERPYECDVCSKSFIYRQGLRQHQRTHTGPRIGPTRQLGRPKQHT